MTRALTGVLAPFGLLLGALALRPQLIAMGPLIPLIQADSGAPHAVTGLLATIPLFCMGLFALAGPGVARRFGPKLGITLSLVTIGAVGIGRGLAPDIAWLVALTIPIGIAMGVGGSLLPVLVRNRFAGAPAFATGMYTNGLQIGSIAGAAAVPIALVLGGWRESLVAISVATLGLAVLWVVLTPRDAPVAASASARVRWPIRSGVAWGVVVLFGLRSLIFQGLIAWMPAVYVDRGWDNASAGTLTLVLIVSGIPATAVASWFADRVGTRRHYLVTAAGALLISILGLVLLPGPGHLWAAAIGLSLGVLFPLTMTLPLDIADRPADVAAAAGMMLGIGYMVAAVSPIGLGAIRDVSGSFGTAILALAAIAVALLVTTTTLTPERLARRRGRVAVEPMP